jgi:hypothetical protein
MIGQNGGKATFVTLPASLCPQTSLVPKQRTSA